MKRQIRRGVFESNSSSVHCITMCTKKDYERWRHGELVYNRWSEELIEITPLIMEEMKNDTIKHWQRQWLTYDQFDDYDYQDCETFYEELTTPGGEEVVAFGYYGE